MSYPDCMSDRAGPYARPPRLTAEALARVMLLDKIADDACELRALVTRLEEAELEPGWDAVLINLARQARNKVDAIEKDPSHAYHRPG